jgi:surface protein
LFSVIRGYQYVIISADSYTTLKISSCSQLDLFYPYDNNSACKSLTLPDRIEYNGNNYTNISFNYTINPISDNGLEMKLVWEKNNIPNSTECLFEKCSNCVEIDLSNFDLSHVTSIYRMFHFCRNLTSVNFSIINTSNVKIMSSLFKGCFSLKSLDLSEFDTSNTRSMFHMFNDCYKLTSLNLSNFDTAKVTAMNSMFSGCFLLSYLDISSFNTSKTKTMDYMFNNCTSLTSINPSHFDTSLVTNMKYMFKGCSNLVSINLSNFDTKKAIKMSYLFSDCIFLSNLDISSFNTMNVIKMEFMFNNCKNLISLNLSNFNISKANITKMFYNCSNLQYIHLKTAKIKDLTNQNTLSFTNDNLILCSENDEWKYLLSNEHLIIYCKNTENSSNSFKCYQIVSYNNNFKEKSVEQILYIIFLIEIQKNYFVWKIKLFSLLSKLINC